MMVRLLIPLWNLEAPAILVLEAKLAPGKAETSILAVHYTLGAAPSVRHHVALPKFSSFSRGAIIVPVWKQTESVFEGTYLLIHVHIFL